MLKLFLLLLGVLTLVGLVLHIGPARIYDAAARLGPGALIVVLLPSVLMYVFETYGWRLTLGSDVVAVPFWRLLAIRTAGEVVNMTTPTAYVGGEPLKAYFLKRYRVSMVEGLASVVIAKTTMTIAQVLFILLGVALAFWLLDGLNSSGQTILVIFVSMSLLAFGAAAFIVVQRLGVFTGLLAILRKLGIRIAYLEAREDKLRFLDRAIMEFYSHDRRRFYFSTGMFFLGWLAEALEVYVMIAYLDEPAAVLSAISIGALSVFIKGGTFFIPGSVGAQDGGNLLLLTAFGYSEVTGITFALLRRFRELVWIAIGLLCLAALGYRRERPSIRS